MRHRGGQMLDGWQLFAGTRGAVFVHLNSLAHCWWFVFETRNIDLTLSLLTLTILIYCIHYCAISAQSENIIISILALIQNYYFILIASRTDMLKLINLNVNYKYKKVNKLNMSIIKINVTFFGYRII